MNPSKLSVEDESFIWLKTNNLLELLESMKPYMKEIDYIFYKRIINDIEFKNWETFNSYCSFIYDKICKAHVNYH